MYPKRVYLKYHSGGAGKWVYEGYRRAWESLGHATVYYHHSLEEIKEEKDSYYVMAIDGDVNTKEALNVVINSSKTFLFAQPNEFPPPWGTHPNFRCHCPIEFINELNELDNVFLWSFGCTSKYHTQWKELNYIPLAFDHLGYTPQADSTYEYDVCFIGGWADNGFNEKRNIMIEHFNEVQKLGIKMGMSINQNISNQDEANLLYNSKISLNLHDQYQRVLGYDVNERTFKSLGLNGFLICDKVTEVNRLFPDVPTAATPAEYVELIRKYLSTPLDEIKERNKQKILDKHTYVNRVESLLAL